ncbi:MAG: asparagine synthase (glutamine-hydrolyzing) [Thermoanaerobaculaceae bacterium]
MCGVVACISIDGRPPEGALVDAMADALRHRGPDGRGTFVNSGSKPGGQRVGLGHRRLAIIDLSDRAAQPMTRRGVTVAFNGEIYNFVELREELESLGKHFSTSSDTEVLLEAYHQWGRSFVDRLNGIFAFVLWDDTQRVALGVRDRLGVKPLYWVVVQGQVFIASEVRALKVALGRLEVNEHLVYDFLLSARLDHCEETFFRGIKRLPAGHILEVRDGDLRLAEYWRPSSSDLRFGRRFEENAEEFGALFRDAVRLQMRADVPVACCLSGGLDSTAVAAVASQRTATPMSVFTARYRHAVMDEWHYAQALHAEQSVLPVSVFAQASDFWQHLDEVVAAQEEPFGGPGVFAQWRLMKEIRARGIKVVLDGQGGDELLCGYAKYFYFHLRDLLRAGQPLRAGAALASALATGGRHLFNVAGARRYLPGGWWLGRRREHLLNRDFASAHRKRQVAHPAGSVTEQQILDITRFGLPVLLRYEDKNSMAHSVESRVPFLDHRLVEFALSVPVTHKIAGARSKAILREALRGTMPEVVRRRRSKLGFGGHWHLWVAELAEYLDAWLAEPRLAVDRYVNRGAVVELLRRRDPTIFHVLVLDRWLQSVECS